MALNNRYCTHTPHCWCWSCHQDRLRQHDHKAVNVIMQDLDVAIAREATALDQAFNEVLNQLALAKAFKDRVYQQYRYSYITCYFKNVQQMTADEARRAAKPINDRANVYENFDKLLANLSKCSYINIKRLSAGLMKQALNLNWCLLRNSAQRPRVDVQPGQGANPYLQPEYRQVLDSVVGSRFYQSIDRSAMNGYGLREKADFLQQLSKDVMNSR